MSRDSVPIIMKKSMTFYAKKIEKIISYIF